MTIDQITALTPEERNRLITEHLGWKFEPMSGPRSLPWRKPNVAAWDGEHWSGRATDIPNYCGSLDLMHEAVMALRAKSTIGDNDSLFARYCVHLQRICGECREKSPWLTTVWESFAYAIEATSDHRAIAFLAAVLTP